MKVMIEITEKQFAEIQRIASVQLNGRLPTVEQIIAGGTPLIQCKDCKHSEHWYRDKSRCFLWHEEGIDVFEDGYCNYAERKEGADG